MREACVIDGKHVWASKEEIEQARDQGLLDEESEAELQFGGGETDEDQ